jgi:hypothetical protein
VHAGRYVETGSTCLRLSTGRDQLEEVDGLDGAVAGALGAAGVAGAEGVLVLGEEGVEDALESVLERESVR